MRPVKLLSVALLVAVILGCRGAGAEVDNPVEKEAEEYLVRYLRIDTSNPPGNETAGATFLLEILRKEGVDARLVGSDPARQGVYARLRSGTTAPALLLLHHIDTVPANPAQWSVPPLSGQRSGGYIWGRGALDVKSLGIANLMAVLDLKRTGAPLARDVIFLGVPDEEAGGEKGCLDLLTNHASLFDGVGFVLNEGGGNETIVDRVSFWGIEVDQKVPLWVRIVARGGAGHGAVAPEDGGSVINLLKSLEEVGKLERPYRVSPTVSRYFSALAAKKPGLKGEILRNPAAYVDSPELGQLSPPYRALLRDTIAITHLQAGDVVNAIPAEAIADLDVRLLPDTDPKEVLGAIKKAVGNRAEIKILLEGKPAPASTTDSALFRTLVQVLRRAEPTAAVGPSVSAGTSDSRYFRARGITAYGISPFKVNYYDANTVHGVDERIRARFFSQGVRLMQEIVREFCLRRTS